MTWPAPDTNQPKQRSSTRDTIQAGIAVVLALVAYVAVQLGWFDKL